MAELSIPLQLSPVFKRKIWGRVDLSPLVPPPRSRESRGRQFHALIEGSKESDRIGEMWLTDDASRFLNGPVAGLTLGEVANQYGTALWGKSWKGSRFPILAKYLFTSDWLSVQVHPDDKQASRLDPGNSGKCEMWFVVDAEPSAGILLGAQPGVTQDQLQAACVKGASKEMLDEFNPQAGEAVYIPPGTVHAIGPGLILFEAEQNSDLTYRLDDYGRRGQDGKARPLHLEKGLRVARLDAPALRNLPRLEFREPFGSRRFVVASRHFAVEEMVVQKTVSLKATENRVEAFSIIEGSGRVDTAAGWLGYRRSETWLIPPGTYSYRFSPRSKTRMLKFYVPDLAKDFREPLTRRGASKAAIAGVVFED
jgi:mannose-6-phosphate isomerase